MLHTGTIDKAALESGSLHGLAAAETAEQIAQLKEQNKRPAEVLGYEAAQLDAGRNAAGKETFYHRPAIEELIRWRLWDRTGAGLMGELGSHQLDAASDFHRRRARRRGRRLQPSSPHPHPLNVVAAADRPIFPVDRDIEDHVYCVLEFPAPGYDPKDPIAARKKIGVMYSSINGNGFGDYGETVYGTEGELILEQEQVLHEPSKKAEIKVSAAGSGARRWTRRPAVRPGNWSPAAVRRPAAATRKRSSIGRGACAIPGPRTSRAAPPRWRWAMR